MGVETTPSLFGLLGAEPILGRALLPDEVVILGHGLWQRRFGGEEGVLGQSILVDEHPRTVVGIMPPDFDFPPPIGLEGPVVGEQAQVLVPYTQDVANPGLRGRMIRQLMGESLLLGLFGGAAGLLLAQVGIGVLVRLAPASVPRIAGTTIDLPVAFFTLGISVAAALLFGLAPMARIWSTDFARQLREGGRTVSEGRGGGRLRGTLVVTEVALSMVLLLGAGLVVRSLYNLQGVDVGFQQEDVVTARVHLPESAYPEGEDLRRGYRELEEHLDSLPWVEGAGFVYDIPLTADRQGTGVWVRGDGEFSQENLRQVNFTFATPGYFDAMGIDIARGRSFTFADDEDSESVVVVNRAFVRLYLEGRDPLDTVVHAGFSVQEPRRIVGVVSDVRHDRVGTEPTPQVYAPYAQVTWGRGMALALKSPRPVGAVVADLRSELGEAAPAVRFYDPRSLQEVMADSVADVRFTVTLLVLFAVVAAVLAVVGIYGVIRYSVSRRTHEIGVRMALGAGSSDILTAVVGQGLLLALLGIVTGVLGGLFLTRLLSSELYGVDPTDPVTYLAVAVGLAVVAAGASSLPARRAVRIDPVDALRQE